MVAKSWFGSMWKAPLKHDANSDKVVSKFKLFI